MSLTSLGFVFNVKAFLKCTLRSCVYVVFVFRLREKHGNDWATIGAALGRSASSVKDRCRLMKDTCNTGEDNQTESEILHLFAFIQYLNQQSQRTLKATKA